MRVQVRFSPTQSTHLRHHPLIHGECRAIKAHLVMSQDEIKKTDAGQLGILLKRMREDFASAFANCESVTNPNGAGFGNLKQHNLGHFEDLLKRWGSFLIANENRWEAALATFAKDVFWHTPRHPMTRDTDMAIRLEVSSRRAAGSLLPCSLYGRAVATAGGVPHGRAHCTLQSYH
jgi:hypothetical protein